MKSLENTLRSVIKALASILPQSDGNPIVRDHIYCGKLFLHQAAKAAMGQRVRSSRALALELASQRDQETAALPQKRVLGVTSGKVCSNVLQMVSLSAI